MICNDICIVHIPKTAGSSLKEIISKKFKKSHDILFDYGMESDATSKVLLEYLYTKKTIDTLSFDKLVRNKKPVVIFGHYHAKKYVNLLTTFHIHTFVRDPFERFLSEFIHHREIYNKDLNFKKSLIEEEYCNVIKRYFDGLRLEDFTSIGNSNNFINDMRRLLEAEGKNLSYLELIWYKYIKKNTSHVKDKIKYILDLDPELMSKENIKKLYEQSNADDLDIYKQIKS